MKTLGNYKKAVQELVEEFYKIYYNEGKEIDQWDRENSFYIIGGFKNAPDMVSMGDEFFDISDIYTALQNKISHEILMQWYDYCYQFSVDREKGMQLGNPTNLYHYNLKRLGKEKKYTKEDIEKAEESVRLAKKELDKCIKYTQGKKYTKGIRYTMGFNI